MTTDGWELPHCPAAHAEQVSQHVAPPPGYLKKPGSSRVGSYIHHVDAGGDQAGEDQAVPLLGGVPEAAAAGVPAGVVQLVPQVGHRQAVDHLQRAIPAHTGTQDSNGSDPGAQSIADCGGWGQEASGKPNSAVGVCWCTREPKDGTRRGFSLHLLSSGRLRV